MNRLYTEKELELYEQLNTCLVEIKELASQTAKTNYNYAHPNHDVSARDAAQVLCRKFIFLRVKQHFVLVISSFCARTKSVLPTLFSVLR